MKRLSFAVVLAIIMAAVVQASIPTSFDARSQWSSCVPAVMDQGSCGSCFIFSGVQVLSSHMCIASNGNTNAMLSPQHVVSCGAGSAWTGASGCDGGWPVNIYSFVKNYGCTSCTSRCTSGCEKYVSGDGHTIPSCRMSGTCPSSSSSLSLYKWGYDQSGYFNAGTSLSTVQQYIINYGPISAAFLVTQSFYNFFQSNPTGVFKSSCPSSWNDPAVLGGHAVIIIGWGVATDGTPYWLLQNSWGTSWADRGIFRMKRGVNLCLIESYLSTVIGSKNLNSGAEPDFSQYIVSDVPLPPYAPGSAIPVDTNSNDIIDILNWLPTQLNLADNEIIKSIIPQSATVQIVNGINFNIKFETQGTNNMFQIDALINRSPDGSLTLLNNKINLIPVVGLFGIFSVGTLFAMVAAPILVIGLATTIFIIRRRKMMTKKQQSVEDPSDELSLHQEFLSEQAQQQSDE